MSKKLTDKQLAFIKHLFGDAIGDPVKAKRLAGYSDTYSTKEIMDSVAEEIYEETKKYIQQTGYKAAIALGNLLDDPVQMGAKEKLSVAKDILDRGGYKPTEKVEIKAETPLFILPEKRSSGEK